MWSWVIRLVTTVSSFLFQLDGQCLCFFLGFFSVLTAHVCGVPGVAEVRLWTARTALSDCTAFFSSSFL